MYDDVLYYYLLLSLLIVTSILIVLQSTMSDVSLKAPHLSALKNSGSEVGVDRSPAAQKYRNTYLIVIILYIYYYIIIFYNNNIYKK